MKKEKLHLGRKQRKREEDPSTTYTLDLANLRREISSLGENGSRM